MEQVECRRYSALQSHQEPIYHHHFHHPSSNAKILLVLLLVKPVARLQTYSAVQTRISHQLPYLTSLSHQSVRCCTCLIKHHQSQQIFQPSNPNKFMIHIMNIMQDKQKHSCQVSLERWIIHTLLLHFCSIYQVSSIKRFLHSKS